MIWYSAFITSLTTRGALMQMDTGSDIAAKERSARAALYTGILDTVVTLVACLAANSSVLLADFLKTALEAVAVLLSYLSLRRIIYGKNHHFNYGIGKLESLSSVFVVILMVLAVFIIFGNAIHSILAPGHLAGLGLYIGAGAQVVFGFLNTKLALNAARLAKTSGSPIIIAQQKLFTSRAVGNVFILLALALSTFFHAIPWSVYIDPVASILIGCFIVLIASGIFKASVNELLDKTLDEEYQMIILQELVAHFDDYEFMHGIRSRRSGSQVFIEIFLGFDPEKKVGDVQQMMDTLRKRIEARIANSSVVVSMSQEPVT